MHHKKNIIAAAIPAGLISFALSFIIGGYILPFPDTIIANAFGNGMSGLISGAISAIVATNVAAKKFAGQAS